MLGTAVYLECDILIYWQYEKRKGWIRYPSAARGPGKREALLIQCIHSKTYGMFHCEPIIEWPIEELVEKLTYQSKVALANDKMAIFVEMMLYINCPASRKARFGSKQSPGGRRLGYLMK